MPKTSNALTVSLKSTLDLVTSEEKAHAVFSASASARWLACPGSISLSREAPEPPSSKYAEEGTKAHACLEFLLKNLHEWDEALKAAGDFFEEEMITHAVDAVRYIEGRMIEHPTAELLCETRVDASPFTCPGQFGTLDVSLVEHFGRLIVMDYKYGAGHAVDPGDNPQMAYYGLALSYQYDHNFSEVEFVIIQPRAFHESGQTVRSVVVTMDELMAWRDRFQAGVAAAKAKDAPHRAGDWCRWCPAKVICPTLKGEGFKKTRVAFREDVGVQSVPEPRMLRAADLGTILEGCDRLEDWIGAVRAHAFVLLERGERIPGYKLVDKRATRKWKDLEEASRALRVAGIGDCMYAAPKLITPAQAEAVLKKEWPKDSVGKMLSALTVKESSGKTMVPDADSRAAVVGRGTLLTALDVDATEVTVTPETKRRK